MLHIRGEIEDETWVLPSGADSLVRESGQERDDEVGPAGGTHGGHTVEQPMQPGEWEFTEIFLEEVTAGLGFKGAFKIIRETKWGNALVGCG